MPELYFSHTEQPVNKKSGGTKMMNRLFKRGTVIALAAAMTTSMMTGFVMAEETK